VSLQGSFEPQSLTFAVTTNGTGSTASAQVVSFLAGASTAQGSGLTWVPTSARVVNTGATVAYISFTGAARVATIPTSSVPSQEFPVLPGAEKVFTLSAAPVNGLLQINTISTGTSIPLMVTFGEGR
jgi:hypothetical protein